MTQSSDPIRILLLVGSRRQRSLNQALAREAMRLAPQDIAFTVFERLVELPFFDEDLEQRGTPASVQALTQAARGADGLLLVSPEYNSGAPALLTNAIDWLSRGESPLRGIAAAVLSASPGAAGGQRAQAHLRHVLASVGALVLPAPYLSIGSATRQFDSEHRLVEESTRSALVRQLLRFRDLVRVARALRTTL